MWQFPTFRSSIVDSILFADYMEDIFILFPILLLGGGPNFLSAKFHLIILFHFYIHLD